MKDKIYLVFDKTKASLKIKSLLVKKLNITSLKKSNVVVVVGGDGFMLQTLKRLYKFKKPFYGINSGNYGFLMNKFSNKNIIKIYLDIPIKDSIYRCERKWEPFPDTEQEKIVRFKLYKDYIDKLDYVKIDGRNTPETIQKTIFGLIQ